MERKDAGLLPHHEFLRTFENAPRTAVNLIITDETNRVLLTRRNIPPNTGAWHIPGGFILKGESLVEALGRVAEKELGLQLTEEPDLLGAFDDLEGDPRGHVIDLAYGIDLSDGAHLQSTEETSEFRFFTRLPGDIGFNHRETLEKLGFECDWFPENHYLTMIRNLRRKIESGIHMTHGRLQFLSPKQIDRRISELEKMTRLVDESDRYF